MKATIDSDTLGKSLARLKGLTGGVGLERFVRADVDAGRMSLFANSMLLQSQVDIEGHGEGKASFCIDLQDFLTIVKHAGKGAELLIEYDEAQNQLVLSRDRGQSRFEVMSGDTIPLWDEYADGEPADLDGALLRDMLSRIMHCVPQDARVAQLNAAFLTTLPSGGTRAVATDGHRLAMRDHEKLRASLPEKGILLPLPSLREVVRLTQDGDAVTLRAGENATSFSSGPETITTKLVDGNYVDYMRVVSFSPMASVRLPRAPFLEAVQHMDALITGSKLTKLVINSSGAHLETSRERLSSAESFDNTAHEDIEVMGFNSTFLADALKAFRGSEVTIEFSGSAGDRVRLSDPDEHDFIQILMPMRV